MNDLMDRKRIIKQLAVEVINSRSSIEGGHYDFFIVDMIENYLNSDIPTDNLQELITNAFDEEFMN